MRRGWEGPQHEVTIAYPFAVGVYEVTWEEYEACVAEDACSVQSYDDEGFGRGKRPVIGQSWEDADRYVQWLSRRTGQLYRLLSEAEWEYVARAGSETARWWGDSASDQCIHANGFGFNVSGPCSDEYRDTAPVGSFPRNEFGLYDVLGNVWEWTQDCLNFSYDGAPTDGRAWLTGDCGDRIIRGGSWEDQPEWIRSAARSYAWSGSQHGSVGFRVARELDDS